MNIEKMIADHKEWLADGGEPTDARRMARRAVDFSNQTFEGVDFTDAIFTHCNFDNAVFNHCIFKFTHFKKCSFENASFNFLQFKECEFYEPFGHGIQLYNVDFRECEFYEADFKRGIFASVNFINSTTLKSVFHQSEMKNVYWTRGTISHCHFPEANITDMQFLKCTQAKSLSFARSKIRRIKFDIVENGEYLDFNEALVEDIEFKHGVYGHSYFHRAVLTELEAISCQLDSTSFLNATVTSSRIVFCNMQNSNLTEAQFKRCTLNDVDLANLDANNCSFFDSEFTKCNFNGSTLLYTDFTNTSIDDTSFAAANLSGAKGLLTPTEALSHFEKTDEGIICYKAFGLYQSPPDHWVIEPGSVIRETVNPSRGTECAAGINVGTLKWIENRSSSKYDIWQCLIPWEFAAEIVVPYSFDGKFRTGYLKLLNIVRPVKRRNKNAW